jgi:pimeloyl-ACP methyl ester carboxylesterase
MRSNGVAVLLAALLTSASARADAQTIQDVVSHGGAVRPARRDAGTVTWVLLSGLVGGVPGFRALERELLAGGGRVITIDPYRLSVDSTDVSFAALARRVQTVLDGLGVTTANLVGHAHGAGVALRVA